jgi:hypothetical protein
MLVYLVFDLDNFQPFVPIDDVLGDEKWRRRKYCDQSTLICALTCELASRVFFGDDVMIKYNVVKDDPSKNRQRLNREKLAELKEVVRNFVRLFGNDFELKWVEAEKSLQNRMKNLRRNVKRSETSAQLVVDDDVDD